MNSGIVSFAYRILLNEPKKANEVVFVDSNGKRNVTWKEFKELVFKVAQLAKKKQLKGTIPILLDRNYEYVASILGLNYAGLAFCPLEKTYPIERISFIKKELGVNEAIDESFILEAKNLDVIDLTCLAKEDDIAAVFYTSGSTGTPKGVYYNNKNFYYAIEHQFFPHGKMNHSVGYVSSFAFIALLANLLKPLYEGRCIHIISDEIRKDIDLIEEYFYEHKINYSLMPTALLKHMSRKLPDLRVVTTAGEKLTHITKRDYRIVNLYGSTETAGVFAFEIDKDYTSAPIGNPGVGVKAYILDENNKEVDEGELCLSGYLSSGYINKELNEGVYTPNPFPHDKDHTILFHTRDIVKRNEFGEYIYINRKDSMVKINGQRVEPGEVELRLKSIKGIKEAVVKSFEDNFGKVYLVGYYKSEDDISEDIIRIELKKYLPSYMVPTFIVRVSKFKLTNNGKIDKSSLLSPSLDSFKSIYVAPKTEKEKIVTEAFKKVLHVDEIGVNDDFFSLGGDSLSVVKLIKEIEGYSLLSKDVFESRTPFKIAKCLVIKQKESSKKVEEELSSYPLTSGQVGIYFACNNEPNSLMYNNPVSISLDKSVDLIKLEKGIRKIISSFSCYKASFKIIDGQVKCLKQKPFVDIESINISEKQLEKKKSEFIKPFYLEKGHLSRFLLISTEKSNYLLLDHHHIIFDGGSLSIFLSNLAKAYESKEIEKEEMSIFEVGLKENDTKKESIESAYSYFKEIISNNEYDSNLYSDDVVNEHTLFGTSKTIDATFSGSFNSLNIETFAKHHHFTEASIFLASFAFAMAKMINGDGVSFTTVNSGRHNSDVLSTIGMLVKTLPIIVKVDETDNTNYIDYIQNTLFKTIENDIYPFHELVKEFNIHNDTMFVYQGENLNDFVLNNVAYPIEQMNTNSALTKITFAVYKQNGEYRAKVTYRDDIYDESSIHSLVALFRRCVNAFLANSPLSTISLIDEKIGKDYSQLHFTSLIKRFKESTLKTPDKVCINVEGKTYSYSEVDRISDNLAKYLIKEKGIKKGDIIAILSKRDEFMVLSTLGAIKSGAIYEPLDSTYPNERLDFMVQDSGAKLLICPKDLKGKISFEIDTLFAEDILHIEDRTQSLPLINEHDGLALLYTSGSTGTPKGVILEHLNFSSFADGYIKRFEINKTTNYAAYASYGFDANMMDMFIPLCNSGTLFIIPLSIRLDLNLLDQFFINNKITHSFMTTAIGRQFALTTTSEFLKHLLIGGEALTPLNPPKFKLYNCYGPTETGIFVTFFEINKLYKNVPIGKSFTDAKFYILDKYLRRVPYGAVGELYISGGQVARGYLNRDDLTKIAFLDNPFNRYPHYSKMYKSGDVVRRLPNGDLQFIGRKDHQVKIRGFRIELTEIEEIIRRFPSISDATVQVFTDDNGEKFIASYIVSKRIINIKELNDFIAKEKPYYMVPSVTLQIDKIPLNNNQKVDKKSLPYPKHEIHDFKKPESTMQSELFDIVKDVLSFDNFGIDTSLFEVGLTSISSVRLVFELSKHFNKTILTQDLRKHDTIEKLEAFFTNKTQDENFEILNEYPLSKNQEGIILAWMNNKQSTTYNIPYLIKLGKKVDINRLVRSIKIAFQAHPILFTRIIIKDGSYCFKRNEAKFNEDIVIEDVSRKYDWRKELAKPFNLFQDKLFRVKLLKEKENYYLFIDVHHIIFDGTSLKILLKDINKAYLGSAVKKETFTAFESILLENKLRQSPSFEEAKNYYLKTFSEVEGVSIPIGDVEDQIGFGIEKIVLNNTKSKNLIDFCNINKITENAFFVSAFGYLLSIYTNEEKSLFTTIYNGRNDPRKENVVSMFVKTFPVLTDSTNQNILLYIKTIAKQMLESTHNDLYSFMEIREDLSISSDVMFVYQGQFFENNLFCNDTYETIDVDIDAEKALLSFEVYLQGDDILCKVEYDKKRFSSSFIKDLVDAYEMILKGFIKVKKLDDINLLSKSALKRLESFHGVDTNKKIGNMVDIFNESFISYSSNIAIETDDVKLTYKELRTKVERLASALTLKGITKGSVVSVLTDRNEFMLIAPLAALEVGAMYQPLDCSYPQERLNFMVEDSSSSLLLTSKSLEKLISKDIEKIYFEDIDTYPIINYDKPNIDKDDPFVILYTSGSTGLPKGCILTHGNLYVFLLDYVKQIKMEESSVSASYASFGFDANMMEIFSPLVVGARLVIIPKDLRLNLIGMNDYLERHEVTHLTMTTQVGRQFATKMKNSTLKYLCVGGETLTPLEPPEGFKIVNNYGPTETTVTLTLFDVDRLYSRVPLGRVSSDIKAYIVDKNLRRLPIGAPGELLIAGPRVSKGYLNREDRTKASYIKNIFIDDKKYPTLYRTGDVISFLPDGKLQFIGRKDSQVKIRGFRIELNEVEEIIRRFPNVKDCTVAAFDEPSGGKFIAAYIVSDEKIDVKALGDFIRSEKPEYMVPSVTMQIDKIPLNQNHKVNKKALPAPIREAQNYQAPENETESIICDIMGEILGYKKYSASDSFFEMGGSSISASKLLLALMSKGYHLAYPDIFNYQSPQKLAKFLLEKATKDIQDNELIEEYDYQKMDSYLNSFNIEKIDKSIADNPSILKGQLGNILLTGATGFLGVHVLKEFIDNYQGVAYCLIRGKTKEAGIRRLKARLAYYFFSDYEESFLNGRIECIDGGLNDEDLFDKIKDIPFHSIVNCAACVKHFSSTNDLYLTNYSGVKNLLNISKKLNKRFIQTSTYSVSGNENDKLDKEIFTEHDLFINQEIDNDYIRSKFLAERSLIEASMEGFDIQIHRLGNLMSRVEDGEFQINFITNAFMRDIRGVTTLGYAPRESLGKSIDMSPIDSTAQALLRLADAKLPMVIYHTYNYYKIYLADFVEAVNKAGFPLKIVSDKEYKAKIKEAIEISKSSDSMSDILAGLIAYKKADTNTEPVYVTVDNKLTREALYRLDFRWPIINHDYVLKAIQSLSRMSFFTHIDLWDKK